MAWIKSHQELATHPKTKRAAVLLDIPVYAVTGLLHHLWWWVLDHAEDGDLTRFDAVDLAAAVGWDGNPEELFKALTECGPGGTAGFIDVNEDGTVSVHDWMDYAGRLVERREADRERKQKARAKKSVGQEPQNPDLVRPSSGHPTENPQRPADVPRTSGGHPAENATEKRREDKRREDKPLLVETGSTELVLKPDQVLEPGTSKTSYPSEFERFWEVYPKKRAKGAALKAWQKATKIVSNDRLIDSVLEHVRFWEVSETAAQFVPYPERWLNRRSWDDELAVPEYNENEPKAFAAIREFLREVEAQ